MILGVQICKTTSATEVRHSFITNPWEVCPRLAPRMVTCTWQTLRSVTLNGGETVMGILKNRVEVLGSIQISRYIQPWWIDNVLDSVQINTIILCLVDVMTLISLCHTPI